MYIKFRHFTKAAYIPAWKVLAGEVSQEEIEGRIILVGTSAHGLLDLRATPVDAAVPGIDIHAQVVERLLTGKFLERPDYALALEQFVILALRDHARFRFAAGLSQRLRSHWLFDNRASPDGRMGRISIWGSPARSIIPGRDPGRHDCNHHLLHLSHRGGTAQPDPHTPSANILLPRLSSSWRNPRKSSCWVEKQREMTILFSDVRGFTTISEFYKNDPQGLTALMNSFLTPLTNAIIDRKGTIDKYMGDAIMAFWNAPLDDPNPRTECLRGCPRHARSPSEAQSTNASRRRGPEVHNSSLSTSASASTPAPALLAIWAPTFGLTIRSWGTPSILPQGWRASANPTGSRSSSAPKLHRR